MPRSGTLLFAVVTLALSACAAPPRQDPIPPDSSPLGKYSAADLEKKAEALLVELKVGDKLRPRVMKNFRELLADPTIKAAIDSPGVNAVGAFEGGGGGMVVSGGGGTGLVSFARWRSERRIQRQGVLDRRELRRWKHLRCPHRNRTAARAEVSRPLLHRQNRRFARQDDLPGRHRHSGAGIPSTALHCGWNRREWRGRQRDGDDHARPVASREHRKPGPSLLAPF